MVVKRKEHEFAVRSLVKGNHLSWRAVLLGVWLFLGAGWQACATVPREREKGGEDFNGWSHESHCLQRKGEEWSIQLTLPPGSYRYGFVIDKREWAYDPDAVIQEDDGFGKKNSLLLIDSAVTKR